MSTPANVNGKLVLPDGGAPPAGSYAQVDLKNIGTALPTVDGFAIYNQKQFPISTVDGTWSGTLYRNDNISINGTFPSVWALTYFANGRAVYPAKLVSVAQATADLDSLVALNLGTTPAPPVQPLTGGQSALVTFAVAASTWTCVHNFNTQAIVVQCYDSNWNQIIPDSITSTSLTTATVTFLQPQAGFMVVFNVGNWTPSVSSPNYLIGNPTSSQGITGDYPFTLGGSLVAKRIEGVRYADQFAGSDWIAKLNAADADLGASAGVIVMPSALASGTATTALALSSAAGRQIYFQPATWNYSGNVFKITQGQVQIIGAGRNNTIFQQQTVSLDAFQVNYSPKVKMSDFSVRYAAQANSGTYGFRITDSSEGTYNNLALDANCYHGFRIEDTAGASTAEGYENHCEHITVRAFSGDAFSFVGTSTHSVLDTTMIDCRAAGGNLGLHISDYVQGTFFEHFVSTENNKNLLIDSTSNANTFDCFFSADSVFDAVQAANNCVDCNNILDLRFVGCWFGAGVVMGANSTINLGSGVKRSGIYDCYIGGQESGTPRVADITCAGTEVDLKGNLFIRGGVAPTAAGIVLTAASSFITLNSNTFDGHVLGTEYSDSGTSNNIGWFTNLGNKGLYSGTAIVKSTSPQLTIQGTTGQDARINLAPNGGGEAGRLQFVSGSDMWLQNDISGSNIHIATTGSSGLVVNGGTTLARYARYTPTLSPASVAASTTTEQTFTGVLTSGDIVVGVSKPTAQAGLGIVGWRASGTSLLITFSNNTASPITPTASETYQVVAVQ